MESECQNDTAILYRLQRSPSTVYPPGMSESRANLAGDQSRHGAPLWSGRRQKYGKNKPTTSPKIANSLIFAVDRKPAYSLCKRDFATNFCRFVLKRGIVQILCNTSLFFVQYKLFHRRMNRNGPPSYE